MNVKEVKGRVVGRGDIEANWNKATGFIPADKEIIIYKADDNHSTPRFKVGDGVTTVQALPFIANIESGFSKGAIQTIPREDRVTQAEGEDCLHFDNASLPETGLNSRVEFGAKGNNSAVLNGRAAALNKHSTAMGNSTVAKGEESLAQGYGSVAEGGASFAGGSRTYAKGDAAASLGTRTQALADSSFAGGVDTIAMYPYQTIIGMANGGYDEDGNVIYDAESLFEVGNGTYDEDGNLIARSTAFKVMRDGRAKVKNVWVSEDDDVITKGYFDYVLDQVGEAFDQLNNSTAILYSNGKIYSKGVATEAPFSITIGHKDYAEMSSYGGIAIGTLAKAIGDNSADTLGGKPYAMAIGYGAQVQGYRAIAIGHAANVTNTGAIALGADALAEGHHAVAIGIGAKSTEGCGTALGPAARTEFGVAIGHGTISKGVGSIAIGNSAKALEENAISIGYWTTANKNQIAIGHFNVGKNDTIFEIGNGTGGADFSNAFEVYKDGHVNAGRATLSTDNELTLITKGYLDSKNYVAWSDSNHNNINIGDDFSITDDYDEERIKITPTEVVLNSVENSAESAVVVNPNFVEVTSCDRINLELVGGGTAFVSLDNNSINLNADSDVYFGTDEVNMGGVLKIDLAGAMEITPDEITIAPGTALIYQGQDIDGRYLSYRNIPWSEFITKVINGGQNPPICNIEISGAYHTALFKDSNKKVWVDLDTFKSGSITINKSDCSTSLIEEANRIMGSTSWTAIYVALRGTYVQLELLGSSGTVIQDPQGSGSFMVFDPETSSDWDMPVISVGIY